MNNKRLRILSKAEINDLYSVPQFTSSERQTHFSLNKKESEAMATRGTYSSKVHFILQLGYFKAASQFFNRPLSDARDDINFILQEHFGKSAPKIKIVSKQTRQSNQDLILNLLDYNGNKTEIKSKLLAMIETKTRLCNNPVYLFHEILCYSDQSKLMLLGYTTIQDLIGSAISKEEDRLGELLLKHLPTKAWAAIDNLLKKEDGTYVLTALKQEPKNFKNKQITGEIKKLQDQNQLYQHAKNVLPKLKLSNQNIRYYSDLTAHYPTTRLSKLSPAMRSVYILCHVYQRYHKINDNLTVTFFHYMKKFTDEVKSKARDFILNEKLEINEDSKKAAFVLRFFDDKSISDDELFGKVRERAYKHLEKGKFTEVSDYLQGLLFDYQKIKWVEISKLAGQITKNIRPIFKCLEFSNNNATDPIMAAILFLKDYFSANQDARKKLLKNAPVTCIPKSLRAYVMEESSTATGTPSEKIDIKRYEFMIYQLMILHIESGYLCLDDSITFRSFSSYLISDKRWVRKKSILENLGNKKLMMSADELLKNLEDELESLIISVNERIENGDNMHIKIKKDGNEIVFTLPYPKFSDTANHPIFKKLKQISIAEVFKYTQKECDFMRSFTHIKPYHAQDILDPIAIMACIIANATNLGIHKMSETSDLNYHRMQTQMKNFIRLETLREANDTIANAIAMLPIFRLWDIHSDRIHGSVDGQKFETRLQSFIARYSSKYFGVNKGVVSYTLCANHIPVNARIISANHHESHYLFDILFNNSSDINIDWLSGDGHSINQVNFTILDFIEKQFAPHFKRINQKSNSLCGFKPLDQYSDCTIKPKCLANKKNIKDEWDSIQRIIASLLLGEVSQHLIVSKLNSYKRKNKTKEALWEYDKILMSIYLLNFINDPLVRQNVRRALNRGEAYHQLRRAIANVHGKKFRGSSERELELWNECARLMTNCVIYYNARFLDALLTKLKNNGDTKMIELLKYISPVAWEHINLYGYYMFEGALLDAINMAGLAEGVNLLKV